MSASVKHIRRTLVACFTELGRRRVLAAEKKLRRHSERAGLKASLRPTGWQVKECRTGKVLLGQAVFCQAEELVAARRGEAAA
jgi:hypothetical protein